MKCIYQLRTDLIHTCDGHDLMVYGVNAVDTMQHTICSVPDVFFDRNKAEEFIKLCNSADLHLIHFMDIINDVINDVLV